MKKVYIAEKPSVAQAFGAAIENGGGPKYRKADGYWESEDSIITWCVGHLVTMSYPEIYDEKFAKWSMDTLPFIPKEFKYEVIPDVRKQFNIVSGILNREDVDTIYICTDSGREGEYIYRLVDRQAGVKDKVRKRVWIDSQTEEEILRGIREAKDDSAYDNLGAAAYLRAKEDYLMGINFSRALTLKYGYNIKTYLNAPKGVVSVGRVMTCVLGIVVDREREIRNFVKTPFYRVIASVDAGGRAIDAEWRVNDKSKYNNSPVLYSEKGFKKREDADRLIELCRASKDPLTLKAAKVEKKKESKNAPLLYNLAELQNDCSRFFKIGPDETLNIAQELYEKKLTTYPRTDARVLSSAICKVIDQNIKGLTSYEEAAIYAKSILSHGSYKTIEKSRYCNDKAITDHYAIIPTGQGLSALSSLSPTARKVYEIIVRRFLAIFFPAAQYQKVSLDLFAGLDPSLAGTGDDGQPYEEHFYASFKVQISKGYLHVMDYSFFKKKDEKAKESTGVSAKADEDQESAGSENKSGEDEEVTDEAFVEELSKIRKGTQLPVKDMNVKEGETSPPKRYNSGSMILTMENAGQFIEDEELRSQIKGSGIGTSATRAGILSKLFAIKYLNLNKKTQIITPTQLGEMVYETVSLSMRPMLNPALTASWEKGLTGVAEGNISEDEYMQKLDDFVSRRISLVKENNYKNQLMDRFRALDSYYPDKKKAGKS
ncbi:DNA topoisomerase [Butyrivibrio sp. MC2013]|uniref:DNA topoisomerase n=1 Tax=Butyrivibrio sp. MC2013 TaxID=1280686 RepID=UPI0004033647|nr:DNA topoisomerase [Butyrivibrio sp. MC2013]